MLSTRTDCALQKRGVASGSAVILTSCPARFPALLGIRTGDAAIPTAVSLGIGYEYPAVVPIQMNSLKPILAKQSWSDALNHYHGCLSYLTI